MTAIVLQRSDVKYKLHFTAQTGAVFRICDYPTNDTRNIIESALRDLSTIWRNGYRYAKAGVMLADFYQSGVAQFDMFSEQQRLANADALMAALDGINRSGNGKVWFAGRGDRDSSWQMKRGMLSPRDTTRIKDIPGIK